MKYGAPEGIQEYDADGFPVAFISEKTRTENGPSCLHLLRLGSPSVARRAVMQSVGLTSYKICWVGGAVLLHCASAVAQAGPKYDIATEAKFKGTIDELKLPPKGSEKQIAYLVIKSGDNTLDIYLCPKSFMDDMGVIFAKGDEIAFTGSKVKQGEADLILAREVVKGTDTLVLRDAKGNPVWNWHK